MPVLSRRNRPRWARRCSRHLSEGTRVPHATSGRSGGRAAVRREVGYPPPGDVIRAALLVVLVAASACGSSSLGGGAADGGDASLGSGDASVGDGDGETDADGGADGQTYSACTVPLAAFCASSPPLSETCVPTLSPADLGVACAFGAPYVLVKGCGGFDELILSGVDSGEIQYFDPTSEELVAIVAYDVSGGGSVTCLGGPPDFVAPSCPGATQQRACPLSDASDSKSGPHDANDGSSGDAGGLDP
jgi:hypothetical protein